MSYVTLMGGKGGSASSFKTRPDTLRSDDSFEMLLGLGSGRWKGLTNGLKSLYVNNVPLENEDNSTNFKDFAVFFADGDPSQEQLVNFKLGGGGGTTQVGTAIGNNTGGVGPWVTAAVTTPNADFIDLRFIVSALYYQDKKGIRENTMNLQVEMRPSGTSNWINPLQSNVAPDYNSDGYLIDSNGVMVLLNRNYWDENGTGWNDPNPGVLSITGKTTSPFVKELRIAVPNTGQYANKTWQIRVRLNDPELVQNDPIEERRTVQWESVAAVSKQVFGSDEAWRGLAWLQVVGKASDQLSGVPSLRGIYQTKIVKTPNSAVFNPTTRAYTGDIWDGSYSLNYTDDPAWCLKDLIEDPISGISAISPGSVLDRWDALEVSKYCSEQVSDGRGGTHPRFSMNLKIDQAQNAQDLVQYIAGAVNSIAWDSGDGIWRMKQDKPESPVALFTRDNIVGEFTYQHTDVDTRYNDYTVTFLNKENNYTEDRARVYDQADIDAYGRKPTTVVAVGANNRQEALRRAMFRLRVSLNENKIVNFVTNRQGMLLRPLDVILVADTDLGYVGTPTASDNRTTTRLVGRSGTTLNLGSSVRLENGVNYLVAFTYPNPNYDPESEVQPSSPDWQKPTVTISRTVTNSASQRGDVDTLYIDSPIPDNVAENAVVALAAANLPSLPRQYRVLDVTPQDDEFVSISALIVDTGKYNAADNVDESAILGQVSNQTVPPPEAPADGMFEIRTYEGELGPQRVLGVSWLRPGSLFLSGFKVEYSVNDGPWVVFKENIRDTYVELLNPTNGKYTFRITSLDRRGRSSTPLIGVITLDETSGAVPPHNFGPLTDRPLTGVQGERYTTTDQVPNVTYVWMDGSWVLESTIVKNADDIYYGGGPEKVGDLKPAEPGATNGMNPAERDDFLLTKQAVAAAQAKINEIESSVEFDFSEINNAVDQLESSVTVVQTNITNLQSATSTVQQSVGTLQQDVSSAQQTIGSIQVDVSAINSGVSALQAFQASANTNLSSLNSSVSTLQGQASSAASSISALQSQAASLQSSVGTINTDLASAVGRITTAEGEVDALQTLTATQGGLISSNATAISNVAGDLASLTTRVSAGRVNLLEFGSFELGSVGWTHSGPYWLIDYSQDWGSKALLINPANGTYVLESDKFSVTAGNTYTISADTVLYADGGSVYVDMIYFNSAGGVLLDGPQNPRGPNHNYSNDVRDRAYTAVSSVAPAGAVSAIARFVAQDLVNCQYAGVRLIKVENGAQWSAYTDEATIYNRALAVQTAEGQIASLTTRVGTAESSITTNASAITSAQGSIASLESTVSSQGGSISTLQSSVTSLTGTVSTLSNTVATQGSSISTLQSAASTAAGDIATLKLDLSAGGGNLLQNTDLAVDTSSWAFNSVQTGVAGDRAPIEDDWTPPGEAALRIIQTGTASGFSEWDQYIAVKAGEWYEASAFCAAHRCNVEVYIQWFNASNQGMSAPSTGQFAAGLGNKDLANWTHTGVKAQAPSGAVRARIILRKYATNSGTDSYAWFARPQIAVTTATARTPKAYSVGSAKSVISVQAQAISTAQGNIASLTTRIGTAESGVSSNASAISTTNGNLASLTTRVGSAEGSITSLSSSYSSLNGTVSTLSGTVSAQGSSISTLQSAVSTAQGNLSTLTTRVDAGAGVNLIVNGGFENNLDRWWATHTGWYTADSGSWGRVAGNASLGTLSGQAYTYLETEDIQVYAGVNHTVSFETSCNVSDPAAYTYGEIIYWDGSGNVVGQFTGPARAAGGDFTPDNSARRAQTFTTTSPANAARCRIRIVLYRANGNIVHFHVRQVKLETGSFATAWNSAASVVQQWQSFNDLNSSFSSLSTTVSSQGGSISTLQSSYTTLSGTVSTLSSIVSSQGSSISSLQSTTSTATGDIATLKTQINAGGGNLLQNTDLAIDTAGWGFGTNMDAHGERFPANTDWALADESGLRISQHNGNTSGYADWTQPLTVQSGVWYDVSARVSAHRCSVEIILEWIDDNGNAIGADSGGAVYEPGFAGAWLGNWGYYSFKRQAPAGAQRARFYFRKYATASGAQIADSYAWMVRPQVTQTTATSASPIAYSPGSARASISVQAQALSALGTSFSSLESRVSSAEGSVSTLQSSMTSANGSISSLQGSVSSLNGSVSSLQQSSSTQAGQISSLQSTVSTQGATISSNSQAITSLTGSVSSLNTIVVASSSPNLCPNGGFENGLRGWRGGGAQYQSWIPQIWVWGRYAANPGFTGDSSGHGNYAYIELENSIGIAGGGNSYTLSFDYDMQGGAGCTCYGEIVWLNSSGSYITQSGTPQGGNRSFDVTGYSRVKGTVVAPNGATTAIVRVVFYAPNGVSTGVINVRQIKFEFGSVATPYSGEATAAQMFQAYSDLNSSHASLSSTVSSQGGSISTLQSTTSTLSGTVSSLSSTVSSQGSSISSLQSVQSTHAGSIATLQQRVTIGGNLLQNTEFAIDTSGWAFYSWNGSNAGFAFGRDVPDAGWQPTNEHAFGINQQNSDGSSHCQFYSGHVPVIGGRWYEASAYVATHRCYSELRIEWYDGNGNGVGISQSPRMDSFPGFYQSNGGTNIGAWTRMWVKAQAPANAARALFSWVKYGTSQDGGWNGATDSWGWMCRPQLAEVYAETVSPTAYFPGKTAATFNSQQTSINALNSQYSSLSTTVATQGSSISSQAVAISTLQGTQATLQSTVSSQGSAISSLQTATSTLQGDAATLRTQVQAGGGINLIKNGGFENGLTGWDGQGQPWGHSSGSNYGNFAYRGSLGPSAGSVWIDSPRFNFDATAQLTASYDFDIWAANNDSWATRSEILWFGSNGVEIARSFGPNVTGNGARGFWWGNGSGENRTATKHTATAPNGTVQALIRVVAESNQLGGFGVRQVKAEKGIYATPYTPDASIIQSFEVLSTLNSQYASLSSTVSTLNSSVSTQQAAINNLNGKTAAWLEMTAVAGNGRAQLRLHADANGGGGVDIVGDVRISGDTVIAGTLSVSALNYGLFVRRGIANVSGTPSAGQTLTLHNQNIGQCQGFGSYSINVSGSFQTNVSYVTSTHNGKPLYTNYVDDGGLIVRLVKNGVTVAEMAWSTDTLNRSSSNMRTVYITNAGKLVEVTDGVAADVYLQVLAIRGNQDTGIVDQGDYYSRTVSASYQSFGANAVGKWTFV